jgi:serine protease Do
MNNVAFPSTSLRRHCGVVLAAAAILVAPLATSIPAPAYAAPAPESFAPLVDQLLPAVVNVYTTQKIKPRQGLATPFGAMPDDPQLEPFRKFFEQFGGGIMPGMPEEGMGGMQEVTSLGSGFIIDASGYVVTNAHVIADAEEISIKLHDNRELKAEVVGRDTKTDLALLKVESDKPLPFVKFGNSDNARVGDWVIAIGNPFGLGGTVTAGIISARSRSINAGPFDDFLQTDAAINRGNSGGPMFNLQGEVIGINTAIFSPSGGNVGIGFAAPASLAQPILKQLREHGRTHRGWLGVKIQLVSPEIAESVGLSKTHGALVLDITQKGPAAKAGVKSGDIITSFNSREVSEMRFLPRLVADAPIGKAVPMTVWRNGKNVTLNVEIGELQEDAPSKAAKKEAAEKAAPAPAGEMLLGMRMARVGDALRARYEIPADVDGLVVVELKRGGTAAQKGLRVGDVLLEIQGTTLQSAEDFKTGLKKASDAKRKHALLRIWRAGEALFITVPVDAK